jgi:hypothetical protein
VATNGLYMLQIVCNIYRRFVDGSQYLHEVCKCYGFYFKSTKDGSCNMMVTTIKW